MVEFVATVLLTLAIVSFPFGEPPIYPMDFAPEHPVQAIDFAPEARVLTLASASYVVSAGPGAHVPLAMSSTQFTSLFWRYH